MAKKDRISTLTLFVSGTIFFSLAWLMPSFPLLSFIGLAPFMAIAANNRKEKSIWTSLELILIGISVAFITASIFNDTHVAYTIAQAMVFTMAFLGYTFVRKSLGAGVSIITITLFWLAFEYVFIKWIPTPSIFLADSLLLKRDWLRWNSQVGYLSVSLWILISNTCLYLALLTERKVNWLFVILFIISVAGPIVYSYTLQVDPIDKDQMVQLYSAADPNLPESYLNRGELIPRTSAWVSVLILLSTLVKRKTSKK